MPAAKSSLDLTFTPKDRLAQTLLSKLRKDGNLIPEFSKRSSVDNDYLDLLENYRLQQIKAP